jgi:hypothetical protein
MPSRSALCWADPDIRIESAADACAPDQKFATMGCGLAGRRLCVRPARSGDRICACGSRRRHPCPDRSSWRNADATCSRASRTARPGRQDRFDARREAGSSLLRCDVAFRTEARRRHHSHDADADSARLRRRYRSPLRSRFGAPRPATPISPASVKNSAWPVPAPRFRILGPGACHGWAAELRRDGISKYTLALVRGLCRRRSEQCRAGARRRSRHRTSVRLHRRRGYRQGRRARARSRDDRAGGQIGGQLYGRAAEPVSQNRAGQKPPDSAPRPASPIST